MSDRSSDHDPVPSRKFVPDVKPLESRILLSTAIPRDDSIVWHPNTPRTGGIAIQSGSVLSCFVGQPRTNAVQVVDSGSGHIQMSWNFGSPHFFTGVTTAVIQAQRARTDQFWFQLEDTFTAMVAGAGSAFEQPGPSAGSTAVELDSIGPTNAANPGESGHPGGSGHSHDILQLARTSGHAVQSGSVLTVAVNRPQTNIVQINNAGGGNVQVEWNGGSVHSFSGVASIVVDTRNARKDQVTLNDPPV